jgi:hypothetical protein
MDMSFLADEEGRVGSLGFFGKNLSRISVVYDFVGNSDGEGLELGDLEGRGLRDNVTLGVRFTDGFPVGTLVGLTVNCSVGVGVGGICGWGVG